MKKKILIIEDQPTMRRNVALMLELEGYTTCTAENGRLGLELARRERPDLVLCDVMMPECDGYAVVEAFRAEADFAHTPFIFLTARADRQDIRLGMNLGADDYLTKPVVRDDLLAAVQSRLARAELWQQRLAEGGGFSPDFARPELLVRAFGLTPREADVLIWVAQGKTNAEIALILGISEKTAKQHLGVCFEKLGVENRGAATLAALEVLSRR
ncbi:MAG: response regulator transcription factor [Verrucomicrobia bacterium]|nr:response regulator transcription factor [Verrucomicrobiota bacterium]